MGKNKKNKKWKQDVLQEAVLGTIDSAPIEELFKIAKILCGADNSIKYYENEKQPQYYQNDSAVRKTLKKVINTGAFDSRARAIEMLKNMHLL